MGRVILALAAEGDTDAERPAEVVSGDPVHRTWLAEQTGGLSCGLWESTPGAWRARYSEWEYVHVREGRCRLSGDDGTVLDAGPGDSFVIRPGWSGIWEVLETLRKEFVILE